jgi:hypothetical protein
VRAEILPSKTKNPLNLRVGRICPLVALATNSPLAQF